MKNRQLIMEIWKEKHGIEVSNMGNVRKLTGVPCNIYHDAFGYPTVTCKPEKGSKAVRIHRMVAESFIENTDNKKSVNHINGNPKDNRVENLEWCTHKENMQHSRRTGLNKAEGENHHWNKLKEHEVLEIFKLKTVYGFSHRLIAALYGMSHQHVSDIVSQKRCWKRIKFELTL